jgi:hypothetical protein
VIGRRSSSVRVAARWIGTGLGVAGAVYGAYVVNAWRRYGQPAAPAPDEEDPLLDSFIPVYEVVERHHIRVGAPAHVTLDAARQIDLQGAWLSRTIFRAREAILGATPDRRRRPQALVTEMQSLGWGVLAEVPGRELVVGAATQPWEANVVFRAVPPGEFSSFHEPGYVKIAWTLRADPISDTESMFRTETRVVATDPVARALFRRYWSWISPGIILIRWALLRPVKMEAERRVSIPPAARR